MSSCAATCRPLERRPGRAVRAAGSARSAKRGRGASGQAAPAARRPRRRSPPPRGRRGQAGPSRRRTAAEVAESEAALEAERAAVEQLRPGAREASRRRRKSRGGPPGAVARGAGARPVQGAAAAAGRNGRANRRPRLPPNRRPPRRRHHGPSDQRPAPPRPAAPADRAPVDSDAGVRPSCRPSSLARRRPGVRRVRGAAAGLQRQLAAAAAGRRAPSRGPRSPASSVRDAQKGGRKRGKKGKKGQVDQEAVAGEHLKTLQRRCAGGRAAQRRSRRRHGYREEIEAPRSAEEREKEKTRPRQRVHLGQRAGRDPEGAAPRRSSRSRSRSSG